MVALRDGVYAAAVTPRRQSLQDINLGVLWGLIDFLNDRGINGIVLMGATGEFVHYSNSERMRMMGLAPRRSRTPVILNVSHSNLDGAVELAQAAAASGAAAVLLTPPHFYVYDAESVRAWYLRFVEESDIDIPVLMYNLPQFCSGIPLGVAAELLAQNVVQGIKDSSGNWEYMQGLLRLREEHDFRLIAGNDRLFAAARPPGLTGLISGCACAVPELLLALDRALGSANAEAAAILERHLNEFIDWIERFPVPVGIREAAILRGQKLGPSAAPLSVAQQSAMLEFREWFPAWLKVMLADCGRA